MRPDINLTNYEAYYLDYLENNLDNESRILFEEFLSQHPELIEEELDTQPILIEAESRLNIHFKEDLKIFDENEEITNSNLENFIIAHYEGILPSRKQEELTLILNNNPQLQILADVYKKTFLQANLNEKYTEKSSLKKGKIRSLYLTITSIAAMFALILYLTGIQTSNQHTIRVSSKKEVVTKKSTPTNIPAVNTTLQLAQKTIKTSNQPIISKGTYVDSQQIEVASNPINLASNNLEFQPATSETLPKQEITTPSIPLRKENLSYLTLNNMEKPLAGITQFLPKKMQQFFDLRFAKATKRKQGGLYIKIGNFEYLRKQNITEEILSVK